MKSLKWGEHISLLKPHSDLGYWTMPTFVLVFKDLELIAMSLNSLSINNNKMTQAKLIVV